MSDLLARIEQRVQSAGQKFTQQDDCWNSGNGPECQFIPIKGQAVGGAQYDLPITFRFPVDTIFIASDKQPTNSKFLSFDPTGKTNPSGGGSIDEEGNENWIQLNTTLITGPAYLTVIRLAKPVLQVYLSMGHESGAQNFFTICGAANRSVEPKGGPYA